MAKKIAKQWRVLQGLHISKLERTLEGWTGRGWMVFSVFGPLGNMAVVLHRKLVL